MSVAIDSVTNANATVPPVTANIRGSRRLRQRALSHTEGGRRVRNAMRALREDAYEARASASTGAVSASLPIAPPHHRRQPSVHIHLNKLEVNMPVDPAVKANHERQLGDEAAKRAKDLELDTMPGVKGSLQRSLRWARKHAAALFLPALMLIDRLNIGINLNAFCASVLSIWRSVKS